ncbi:DUF5330 domain-containing protein [[Pseudomonas] carboxydohydrogena]|uniref:DUF5330 domain-containing protein n=1 Tax=Afipia carboxydohydrogena TaxID=290 RepID=A0ABY8BMF0_AFICR|nr:DUF5330 domain-containing protein [[Pseudomonas] carboxydohydrogena]WEF50566.1 DUF5330 domain-containing protein [[Pseudomonas] carboxydohydrogena]
MFFLLRMAFWLGLVLVLLPRDKAPDTDKGPQVSASEAVLAATAAVSDMSQFCTRQPAACAVGGQAATVVGERAQAGAKKVYDFLTERNEKNDKAEKPDSAEKPQAVQEKIPEKAQEKIQDKPKKGKHGANERKSPDHTGSIEPLGDANPFPDTLTQADLAIALDGPQPVWDGPQP